MTGGVFRVLSIDGGGIRGAFAARFLEEIERYSGRPVHQFFDLICGTSTGGIISLGLALGIPARTISALYREKGSAIFPKRPLSKLSQIWGAKYSNATLTRELRKLFGEAKLKDCKTRVCIPAMNTVSGRVTTFKTRHHDTYVRDFDLLAWKVALATSAAPTYFPAASVTGDDAHIDGGLWANNPALVGFTEAIGVLGQNPKSVSILSIGTGASTLVLSRRDATRPRYAVWARRIFDFVIEAQSQTAENQLRILQGRLGGLFERINPPLAEKTALDDTRAADLLVGIADEAAKTAYPRLKPQFFASLVAEPFVHRDPS